MSPTLLIALVLAVYTFVFTLDALADFLNLQTLKTAGDLPPEFREFYDAGKYRQSQDYLRVNTRFALIQKTASFLAVMGFFWVGGFHFADVLARSWNLGEIWTGLIFVGILSFLRVLLGLPFRFYHTFVIEERFGFNRTTPLIFVKDLMQGMILGAVLGGAAFAGILYFFQKQGDTAWLWAWGAFSAFQLILSFLAPVFLLPLFNKFTPVPDGEIRAAIDAYAKKNSFQLQGIFTMDGSKRSTKANAFFTGFGSFRKLVLFDTLVAKLDLEELMAVLAHEVGHFKKNHIIQFTALSIGASGVMFYFFHLLLNQPILIDAFQIKYASTYASIVATMFVLSPLMGLMSIPNQALSRKFEFEADEYSTATYGKPQALSTALRKLSVDHLSHLSPHWLKVMLDYTHPPVVERMRALTSLSARGP